MKKIKPSVELWSVADDWQEMVARAARLCYASEKGKLSAESMCEFLKENKHMSMFRHGSVYYVVPKSQVSPAFQWIWMALTNSPYVGVRYCKRKINGVTDRVYFIATNMQYVIEHEWLNVALEGYACSVTHFIEEALYIKFFPALSLIRYTICATTQISTSRELNRTSPNNIAEQSTRYVNFGKKGGITICLPHWYESASWIKRLLANVSWKVGEWVYMLLLRSGLPPQDARTSLPIDTATRVAYTYSIYEWRRILNLRLLGTTGKPHPNAKIIAQQIHDVILPAMQVYGGPKAKLLNEINK